MKTQLTVLATFPRLLLLLLVMFFADMGAQATPLRRPISPQQPMWLIHIDTWNYADPQKIIDLVPPDIRPFVVMNISLSISHDAVTGKWLRLGNGYETAKSWLRVCAENGMWTMIQQSSGGFAHFSDTDLTVYESFYRDYPNFIGFNYAEQFWGYDDPNDSLSPTWISRINHFADLLALSNQYGGYLVVSWCGNQWSPSINPIGMLKRSPAFAAACRNYTENYILCEKYTQESYQHDMESLCLGAYLSGYSGQYGIRYDDTGWTDSAGTHANFTMATYSAPFLEHVMLTGQTVIDAPELIWTQCFRETNRVSVGDGYTGRNWDTFPQFGNVCVDLFRKVLDGTVRIPSRQEVIDRSKVVIVNNVNSGSADTIYSAPDTLFDGLYRMEASGPHSTNKNFFKKTGRYPTVPTVYQLDDAPAQSFAIPVNRSAYATRWPSTAAKTNEFNSLFPAEAAGDLYAGRHENGWVIYNPFKTGQTASGSVPFKYNTCDHMELTFSRYTAGVVKEFPNRLEIYLNNHDVQVDNTLKTDTIAIHGASTEPTWSFVNRGTTAPAVTGAWSGGVLTLTVVHNGPLDLTVNCSGTATGRLTAFTSASISQPKPPAIYTGPRQYEGEHFDYKSIDGIDTNAAPGTITGFWGQGFLRFGTNAAASVRERASVPSTGTYRLQTRYSVEGGSRSGIDLYVNGTRVAGLNFAQTASFSDWAILTQDVNLNSGSNTIEFRATGTGARNIYFDSIVVIPTTYTGGLVIQENEDGFGAVDGVVGNGRAGFTGTGYADTGNTAGAGIDWWLDFPSEGTAAFTFRHAGEETRIADLYVNGVRVVSNIVFPATGSPVGWDFTAAHGIVPAGLTHVRLQAVSASGLPDIDFLGVGGDSASGSLGMLADTYVRGGGSAGTNFGTVNQLVTKYDAVDLSYSRETYLKLDVSALANVQSAQLKLVPFQVDGAATLTFQRLADDTWSETGMMWNNRPTAAGTTVATAAGFVVGQQTSIDLTAAVKAEAAGDGILSLRVSNDGWNFVGFHSREQANVAFRPVLEYSIAVPTVAPGAVKAAYLRFDEVSGPSAADSTGNGWNGTLVGNPAWVSGANARIEGALALSGGSHVTLPNGIVGGVDDFTIGFWLKPDTLQNESRAFDFSNGSAANSMSFTPRTAGGVMRFSIVVNGISQILEAPPAVQFVAGTWTHLAVTKTGVTAKLYINGTAVATSTTMTNKPSYLGITTANYIGRSASGTDPALAGKVDDFRIYRGELGVADIVKLANPPAAPSNLTASPINSQVILNWSAVNGATAYVIKRATASGGPYTALGSVTATTYQDTAVINGTTYFYVVTAGNGIADGTRSTEASATPKAFVQSGGIVSMEAENGFLGSRWQTTASAGASNAAYIEVKPVYNNTGTAPDGATPEYVAAYPFIISAAGNHRFWFRVFAANANDDSFYWRLDGGNWTMENGRVGSGTWYSVDNAQLDSLAAGSHLLEIGYRENGTGLDKFVIQPDSLAAPTGNGPVETQLPSAPLGLNATTAQPLRIDLTWQTIPGALTYTVKRSTTSGGDFLPIASGLTTSAFTDGTVAGGTTYYYIVTASNVIGEGAGSAQVGATPLPTPITADEMRAPSITMTGGNASLVTATTVIGRIYQLQRTGDLAPGGWESYGPARSGTGGPLEFVIPVGPADNHGFYRLHILQP